MQMPCLFFVLQIRFVLVRYVQLVLYYLLIYFNTDSYKY